MSCTASLSLYGDGVTKIPPLGSAYGFRVQVAESQYYLNIGDRSLPPLNVRFEAWPPPVIAGWFEIELGPKWLVQVSPPAREVRCYTDPPYTGDAIVHPGLGAAAVVATLHLGGEALHAGTVLTPDGAVGLLAEREGGKTTTLGYLATQSGLGVLTDDQLVIRDGVGHAGPRCLDLRAPAAEALGLRDHTTKVRGGERYRYRLPDVPLSAPIAGLVLLEWGDTVAIEPVPPSERLAHLGRHRTLPGQAGGRLLPLSLAALPMRRLTRPRGVEHLPAVARALLGG